MALLSLVLLSPALACAPAVFGSESRLPILVFFFRRGNGRAFLLGPIPAIKASLSQAVLNACVPRSPPIHTSTPTPPPSPHLAVSPCLDRYCLVRGPRSMCLAFAVYILHECTRMWSEHANSYVSLCSFGKTPCLTVLPNPCARTAISSFIQQHKSQHHTTLHHTTSKTMTATANSSKTVLVAGGAGCELLSTSNHR